MKTKTKTKPKTQARRRIAKRLGQEVGAAAAARQWTVTEGVALNELDRALEDLSARGWTIGFILGPFSGGLAIVASRVLVRD
jgi:hypothetical protein